MIEEEYVSFEVAKLLKEKGFNESIRCWYDNFQGFHEEGVRMRNTDCLPPTIMCPTQQMAMRWMREVHKIDIVIFHEILERSFYWCRIEEHPHTLYQQDTEYATYEEAVEAALKYCLENLVTLQIEINK